MGAPNQRLPELETTPKPVALMEAVTAASLVAAVLALFLFAWVADNVVDQRTRTFDLAIRTYVHQFASPAMTRLMFTITYLGGNGLVMAAFLALLIFLHLRWRRATVWLLITLAGATILDVSLKLAFHRPRPAPFFGPIPHTYSFPSGHALFSFCFYGVVAGLVAGRLRSHALRALLWICAALLVLAIGTSRIYLGVHYPSDVIGGYLTATIWVATMVALDRLRLNRKNRRADTARASA